MLTIGRIASKFGVSARSIRHYEAIGLLNSRRDGSSNYRLYGEAEYKRLDQIMLLKGMGFTLKEVSSIITSNGNKKTIIHIIRNRLRSLTNKSLIYSQCIDLLNEFLDACSMQEDESIDSFKLLNEVLATKNKNPLGLMPDAPSSGGRPGYLGDDPDLEVLKACMSEDFNPLYLPFVIGQEDGDLLENFFVSHRRFWRMGQVLLSDGTNLQDIYNPTTFRETIAGKIGEIAYDPVTSQTGGDFSYKSIVAGLCNNIIGIDYKFEDSLPVLEMKLVEAIFSRAVEMLELAGQLKENTILSIAGSIDVKLDTPGKDQLAEAVNTILQSGGIESFNLAKLVNNAVKRNRFTGPFYVLTEASAFSSINWEFDRALDMAVGFLWKHEISPAGQPYNTLFPVIFHIAYIRSRLLYASASHVQPEIMHEDEFMLIGLEIVTTDRDGESSEKVPGFEAEYVAKGVCDRIPNRAKPGIRYGLVCRYKDDHYSYISGEQVNSLEDIPDGMTGERVPAGTYAVFIVKGGPLPQKVIETVTYAYRRWLPSSGYQWENRPGFNLFLNDTGGSDSDIRIYVPVKEKEAGG